MPYLLRTRYDMYIQAVPEVRVTRYEYVGLRRSIWAPKPNIGLSGNKLARCLFASNNLVTAKARIYACITAVSSYASYGGVSPRLNRNGKWTLSVRSSAQERATLPMIDMNISIVSTMPKMSAARCVSFDGRRLFAEIVLKWLGGWLCVLVGHCTM